MWQKKIGTSRFAASKICLMFEKWLFRAKISHKYRYLRWNQSYDWWQSKTSNVMPISYDIWIMCTVRVVNLTFLSKWNAIFYTQTPRSINITVVSTVRSTVLSDIVITATFYRFCEHCGTYNSPKEAHNYKCAS